MSTRKIATALGAAVLLLGTPASYALASEGKPDRPAKVKQCSDGVDNDGDGFVDVGNDADCGSAKDNSESPDEPEGPGEQAPGAPALPAELQAVVDEVTAAIEPEESCEGADCPPAEEEPPAEEPAPDPAAAVQALVDEVLGQLPPAEAPALPELPAPGAPELPGLPELPPPA